MIINIFVSESTPNMTVDGLYLIKNSWDDWFTFETTYTVQLFYKSQMYYIGSTKIGDKSSTEKYKEIYGTWPDGLPVEMFSLGTDESFYSELIRKEISEFREEILVNLNDIAFNQELFEEVKNSYVFNRSLSRGKSTQYIKEKLSKLAHGNIQLTDYMFSYSTDHIRSDFNPVSLDFEVIPSSIPPTNIHSIIGRNGVGKSFILSQMIESLVKKTPGFTFKKDLEFEEDLTVRTYSDFSNLLSVNFSSFENKNIFKDNEDPKQGIIYHHIGSTMFINDEKKHLSPDDLTEIFITSLSICLVRKPRLWVECVNILYSDPVFASLDIIGLGKNFRNTEFSEYKLTAVKLYDKLSSGHKIVLLTLCKLVELSSEKTLLIMDEPELHLHPPLLSSLIRSISYLLEKVNGVSIMATHSPIVLQETPKSCVWILNRHGSVMKNERPKQETFAEDVSALTREVFSLEVTNSGFYNYLKTSVDTGKTYDEIVELYNNQLSIGGRSILRNLVVSRDRSVLND